VKKAARGSRTSGDSAKSASVVNSTRDKGAKISTRVVTSVAGVFLVVRSYTAGNCSPAWRSAGALSPSSGTAGPPVISRWWRARVNRLLMIADAVRYMSVHSRKQPDSHGRSGTTTVRSTTARNRAYAQATGRFRR
jgi:hypothetical protein